MKIGKGENEMNNSSDYTKGFIIGALIGGAAGAITALLLAPKSGAELRKDIADTSTEFYGKASDYFKTVEGKVEGYVNEGKIKAQTIIDSARKQAEDIMSNANTLMSEAKNKAINAKDSVSGTIDNLRDAAKAGADAFKAEMRSSKADLNG